jgi:hypothetical protein
MSKFLFLYKGYTTPTPEIGQAWMTWFHTHADRMIDSGNPMGVGAEVTPNATDQIEPGPDSFTGYSILNADSMDEAIDLARTNPMITSVVVYELARM